jgi:hypothetical protein
MQRLVEHQAKCEAGLDGDRRIDWLVVCVHCQAALGDADRVVHGCYLCRPDPYSELRPNAVSALM